MKTTLDIVDILFTALDSSSLKTAITGTLCKHKRDFNSNKEDVVINSLPVNNEQLQQGIANVNIHVPDIDILINGGSSKQPNHLRMQELAAIAVDILENNYQANLFFTVQQQQTFEDPAAGDHYINIRIEIFIENL